MVTLTGMPGVVPPSPELLVLGISLASAVMSTSRFHSSAVGDPSSTLGFSLEKSSRSRSVASMASIGFSSSPSRRWTARRDRRSMTCEVRAASGREAACRMPVRPTTSMPCTVKVPFKRRILTASFGGTILHSIRVREVHGKDFTHSLIHLAHLVSSCWRSSVHRLQDIATYCKLLYPDDAQTLASKMLKCKDQSQSKAAFKASKPRSTLQSARNATCIVSLCFITNGGSLIAAGALCPLLIWPGREAAV